MTVAKMDEKPTVRPLPYPIDQYQTHYEGCWRLRRHHNCAVLEVDRLRDNLRRARGEVQRLPYEPMDERQRAIDMVRNLEVTKDGDVFDLIARLNRTIAEREAERQDGAA